ncbi:hypothetical protein [Absidia glauca]|uniref:BTB domain-containing protein n=1 Tax=Absidia glauca TaxID=4829 RepID=A0A168MKC9_ABSGL|nr:hypothetical protein [Absidia glauca]
MLKSSQTIKTTGDNLVGLWRPSFVKKDYRLFVYGGGGNVTNDLHVLNLCTMRWETIKSVKGVPPSKRYGHTATLWNHYIIVFGTCLTMSNHSTPIFLTPKGGCNESQAYCNDIHIFDLETLTWCQPDVSGSVSARYLHSAVVYDDKLFVYGGFAKNTDCTYVLDEISVLDLKTFSWRIFNRIPPRYNHSATLIGHKMYIYAGKDEQGNTVSDLFMVNLNKAPYTPHMLLSGTQTAPNSPMVLLKSQHFCEAVCGKLLVFGRYVNNKSSSSSNNGGRSNTTSTLFNTGCSAGGNGNRINGTTSSTTTSMVAMTTSAQNNNTPESIYGLWMLDLDSLEWERQECKANFDTGGWNYFTVVTENLRSNDTTCQPDDPSQAALHNLFFLGNNDPLRPQGYDHFRDALVINGESLGLYDIPPAQCNNEFGQLLNNPELSDFTIVAADGQELHVHQVILITRWIYFRNMYKSGMMETQQRRMEISEPYPVVLALLKYLYTDQLAMEEPWQVVCDVLVMANMYLLHRLTKICCQRLYERHLTIESCTTIFEKAIMAEEVGLKSLVLEFMFAHYGVLIKAGLLNELSSFARQEFSTCIPEEAVLHVGRSIPQEFRNALCYPSFDATPQSSTSSMSTSSSTSSMSTSSSSAVHHLHHPLISNYSLPNDQQRPSVISSHPSFPSPSDSNTAHSSINRHIHSSAIPTNERITLSTSHQRLSSSSGMMVGV